MSKAIKKWEIIQPESKEVIPLNQVNETTLIVAKDNLGTYFLEKCWINHTLNYFLVNAYSYKITNIKSIEFKQYLENLINSGYELTLYLDWDDILKDINIKIPRDLSKN